MLSKVTKTYDINADELKLNSQPSDILCCKEIGQGCDRIAKIENIKYFSINE